MRILFLALGLTLITLVTACAPKNRPNDVSSQDITEKPLGCDESHLGSGRVELCSVGIVRLIANPELYDGRLIHTNAYLIKVFDRYVLSYTPDRYLIYSGQDSIVINASLEADIPAHIKNKTMDRKAVAVDVMGTVKIGKSTLTRSILNLSAIKGMSEAATDMGPPPLPPTK